MGHPIRVGFGGRGRTDTLRSIEHVIDASFLSISNGNEVFAQINPIVGQRPTLDSDSLTINFRTNLNWTILIGSNGFSDRLMIDRFKGEVTGNQERYVGASWYSTFNPEMNHSQIANPLWTIR